MKVSDWKSATLTLSGMLGLAIFLSATVTPPRPQTAPVATQEIVLGLDPAQTKVHWIVDSSVHTVHGTFALKSGVVHFDPESGKAGGEIVVFATSGDSGNSSRNEKMHKEVLESAKYPDVAFHPTQVEGKVARTGGSDVKLHGIFVLHGAEHELIVPVHAELGAGQWKGTAKFEVPFIKWGLKDPSNWLLKVKPIVQVELEMAGTSKAGN
jgi:polyisoprenoid-binding protein YceI